MGRAFSARGDEMTDGADLISSALPTTAAPAGAATLQVRVRTMRWEASGVLSLELAATGDDALPPFEPGAHVDLRLPDGTMRQYSLCGDPSDWSHYRVAVRAVGGGLSSSYIHRKLRPGELVTISAPRNNFPLLDAARYIFVAGGIGITPLLPMMRQAGAAGKQWTLLYCNKRDADAPFLREVRTLGGEVSLHCSEAGTRLDVGARFGAVEPDTMVYCCGPEQLMSAVEQAAVAWPADNVRFEWFAPRSRPLDETSGGFEVVCNVSGLTLTVPPDKSVLAVLNDAGVQVPCSCQQGICGTCELRVLSGEVDHRDSILSSAERTASETMMTCVSRARSPRLVIDI
jgi:tetrachlorobenzoquinone reductase